MLLFRMDREVIYAQSLTHCETRVCGLCSAPRLAPQQRTPAAPSPGLKIIA